MTQSETTQFGTYRLDPDRRMLIGEGGEAELSPLACRFLQTLAREPGKLVSRSELIDELWAGNYLVGDPALNRLVSETRRAARAVGPAELIETVQKSGYRLVAARRAEAAPAPAARRLADPSLARWAFAIVVLIVIFVGLILILDTLMALAWVSRHPD